MLVVAAIAGLALGTLWTSVLFLSCIVAVVTYLSVTGRDRTEDANQS